MVLNRIDEFEVQGRRFTLYEGGSFVLFEEDGDEAEGIGTIVRSDTGFVATAWSKPGQTVIASTLPEAVDGLVEIAADTHWATDDTVSDGGGPAAGGSGRPPSSASGVSATGSSGRDGR